MRAPTEYYELHSVEMIEQIQNQWCHCETVTDVTVVAIRIPQRRSKGERIPTSLTLLGMTGVWVSISKIKCKKTAT